MVCNLCGNEIPEGRENNAAPFEGKCCSFCAKKWVLPARMGGLEIIEEILITRYGMPKSYLGGKEEHYLVHMIGAINFVERGGKDE